MSRTWTHRLQPGGVKILRIFRNLAQAVADGLTKKLFLAAYEASDDAYWRRHAAECEWRSLGGIVEYTPDLLAVPCGQAAPIYLIAFRTTSNTDLERVVVKLKAKKSGIVYQQEIILKKLCGIPVRKALTAIPLKPRLSKGGDWDKLGDIYIRLAEASDCDGVDLAKGKKNAQIFPSTSTNAMSHNEVERWGQYWNIDAINVEKENIKTRCYRELVQSARKLGRPLTIRRMAYRLLTSRLGVAITFWSRNLWSAVGIRDSIAQAETSDRPVRDENRPIGTTGSRKPIHRDASAEAGS